MFSPILVDIFVMELLFEKKSWVATLTETFTIDDRQTQSAARMPEQCRL
jgi:hypothetical protein